MAANTEMSGVKSKYSYTFNGHLIGLGAVFLSVIN
jgi:hypothetical protein